VRSVPVCPLNNDDLQLKGSDKAKPGPRSLPGLRIEGHYIVLITPFMSFCKEFFLRFSGDHGSFILPVSYTLAYI
jgi:hypothetical protein